jgi:hypothetical protein
MHIETSIAPNLLYSFIILNSQEHASEDLEDFFGSLFLEAKNESVFIVEPDESESDQDSVPDVTVTSAKFVKQENSEREFNRLGRSSAKDLKSRAFDEPVMTELAQLMKPCNKNCLLGHKCLEPIPLSELFAMRKDLWNELDSPAPLDKERGQRFLKYMTAAKQDANGNLVFTLENSGHVVCEGAFLRLLGSLPNSTNPSDAAPLWGRLKNDLKKGTVGSSLSAEKLKLDKKDTFTQLKGEAKSYILAVCADYADSFVTVSSTGTL